MLSKYLITDIGSTTTKAILIEKVGEKYQLKAINSSATSVEKPNEDVKIGIYNAVKKLEIESNCSLLKHDSSPDHINFNDDIAYLSTSSAGGGLQILVIGLTKADSASSAERAAFGVGGVLLDTIAIDDGRSNLEKMRLFNQLHPDIILFCGGVDGGALFSVFRLAELLKISKPKKKFALPSTSLISNPEQKIPLVFAGNQDAVEFIKTVFNDKFQLEIVENLRPTMTNENLKPASEKIHDLFMNNVMEQAPGYSQVKKCVSDPIIPTPKGVLNLLSLLAKANDHCNILSFDIGGATTDFFSNINGDFFRTVSANYGMSYSIGNVLADSNQENLINYLHSLIGNKNSEEYLFNYIANKILHPEHNPKNEFEIFAEHITAIQAIKLSKTQHMKMHFKAVNIGFLDKIKHIKNRNQFNEQLYYPEMNHANTFKISDFKIIIGSGGMISHASIEQAIMIMAESIIDFGITELWRDIYFISPHLGKLSEVNEEIACEVMNNSCFEKLSLVIKPYIKNKSGNNCLNIESEGHQSIEIKYNEVHFLDQFKNQKIKINCAKDVFLNETCIQTSLPLLIDTRTELNAYPLILINALKAYNIEEIRKTYQQEYVFQKENVDLPPLKRRSETISLPYEGTIKVKENQEVNYHTILGENLFDPPRIYVIMIASMTGKTLSESEIREGLLVKEGDVVNTGQKIFVLNNKERFLKSQNNFYAPVRGIIEKINYQTGTIISREIQDYPLKPVSIDISGPLKIQPKHIKGYLKKKLGDFVYSGELLASNFNSKPLNVSSPYTGTIMNIDTEKGIIEICYDKEPYILRSNYFAKVNKVAEKQSLVLDFEAREITGKIGFGKESCGYAIYYHSELHQKDLKDRIIFLDKKVDAEMLRYFAESDIKGLVCSLISYSDLKNYIGKDIGVALTGNENIPYPIILMDGFSVSSQSNEACLWMKSCHNYFVSIKAHTQIRAGVTRPVIYVFDHTQDEKNINHKW